MGVMEDTRAGRAKKEPRNAEKPRRSGSGFTAARREKQRQDKLFLPLDFPFRAVQDLDVATVGEAPIHR